ncbi:MAG: hypothetical protein ACYC49_11440 [Ignavibacteriaceae bacterium]
MKIQDDKKRERIYTHHKVILNKEVLIGMLSGWTKKKFNEILEMLKQKEVIEITGNEVKIFLLPISEKEFKNVKNNETIHQSFLTDDESELLTLLTMQSTASQ